MLLLAIPAVALGLGLFGVRTSARAYLLIGTLAVVICYIAYTR